MRWFSHSPRAPQRWLLLDVDGTLSPTGRVRRGQEYLMASAPEGNVAIPAWIPGALRNLQDSGIRLAWYTAWTTTANGVIAPLLNLHPIPVSPLASGADEPAVLKAAGLAGWAEYSTRDRYVVLDDDLPDHAVEILPRNVRATRIDPSAGIQPHHLADAHHLLGTWTD